MSKDKPVYITAPEAGRIIGLSGKTVYRLANDGLIFRRPRGKARYLKADVEAYARREAEALAQHQS